MEFLLLEEFLEVVGKNTNNNIKQMFGNEAIKIHLSTACVRVGFRK